MVIHQLHGADSRLVESVPVLETFQGKTVWEGVVELFDLLNLPKANRCYAWSHPEGLPEGLEDKGERFVAVIAGAKRRDK